MRYGNIPEPYVPQVKVPNLAEIDRAATENAFARGRTQDASYERGARQAYDNVLAGGGSPMDGVAAMRSQGYGSAAQGYATNAMNTQKSQASMAKDMDDFIRMRAQLAQSQADWDMVLNEAVSRFGLSRANIPQTLQAWSPDLGRKLALGGLTAAQQIEKEYKDAAEQRAQAEESRKAALFPGQVEAQRLGNENTRGLIDQRREEGPLRIAERDARLRKLEEEAAHLRSKAAQTHSNIQAKFDEFDPSKSVVYGFNRQTGIPEMWNPQTGQWVPFGAVQQGGQPATQPGAGGASDQPPANVAAQINEGQVVTFGNGQQWTKRNGQMVRVK